MFGFEKFGGTKKEVSEPKRYSFEEMASALPEELQAEYRASGEKIEQMSHRYSSTESEIPDEELIPEDRELLDRHGELERIARENLEKN